jgi:hypothetical protein
MGRKGPQPLGTVVFEEIEEKARETLKGYPGMRPNPEFKSDGNHYNLQGLSYTPTEARALTLLIAQTCGGSSDMGSSLGCWSTRLRVICRYDRVQTRVTERV